MLIFPKLDILSEEKLSYEALGVLSSMVNVADCDYCTLDELCKKNPADSKSTVKKALNELMSKNFLVKIGNKYAVNKIALVSDFSYR